MQKNSCVTQSHEHRTLWNCKCKKKTPVLKGKVMDSSERIMGLWEAILHMHQMWASAAK